MHAKGTFESTLSPLDSYAEGMDNIQMGRMSIDKTFSGDLVATSQGEMLSAMTATQGSAAYVAIEQVSGVLLGKSGSFVLQHFGIMDKGADSLRLAVVPDSASGELIGLRGDMTIEIKDGVHHYTFDYTL